MLFFGLPSALVLLLVATAFLAGLARGFSGFGGALIFVPVASAIIGPKIAVPLLLIVDFVASAGMVPDGWRRANRREVAVMAIGALAGIPLGTWVLTTVDPVMLRWGIVSLAAGLLVLLISGWRYKGSPHALLTAAVGAVSGLFSGVAQVGGPPVVAYWLGSSAGPQNVRANIVLYFLVSSIITLVTYLYGGLITREVLWLSLLATPAFGLGILIGSHMFSRADEQFFRRVCYGLIALAVLAGLPIWDSLRA